MKKRYKKKRKIKKKKILLILSILLILYILFNFKINFKINSRKNILKILFQNENYLENYSLTKSMYSYFNNYIFNTPINILNNDLKNNKNEISNLVYVEKETPIIYIYNSHQKEQYSKEYLEDYNIVPDVKLADSILKDKLDNFNVNVIIEEEDIALYMKNNNLDHAKSYKASRIFLKKAIENYPQAILYIDLHRDAATHKATTTLIDNKPCAKVLFVIGLENQNFEYNLAIANKINNILLNKYPTLTRGIMKKKGLGVNGIYNQDLAKNVILIEIGGNENNIEEITNTLEIMAKVLKEYIDEEEKK